MVRGGERQKKEGGREGRRKGGGGKLGGVAPEELTEDMGAEFATKFLDRPRVNGEAVEVVALEKPEGPFKFHHERRLVRQKQRLLLGRGAK